MFGVAHAALLALQLQASSLLSSSAQKLAEALTLRKVVEAAHMLTELQPCRLAWGSFMPVLAPCTVFHESSQARKPYLLPGLHLRRDTANQSVPEKGTSAP